MAEQFLHRSRVELIDAFEIPGVDAPRHEQAIDPEAVSARQIRPHRIPDRENAVELHRMAMVLGGEAIFYGKPHRPIYERALALAGERQGHAIELNRVLAIGDSVRTDLAGAHGFGIDCLFVTRGIHAEDFEGIDQLDPASVKELFGHPPLALMRELRW